MCYEIIVDPKLQNKIKKLYKKDRKTYDRLKKKLLLLSKNPEMGKPLRNVLKNRRRLHVAPFVLIYRFDKDKKVIELLDFDHHDKVYKRTID
ncbi:type II toxin-antitoxin system RelE family toxin [Candidatus Pyrohabitans sp.]